MNGSPSARAKFREACVVDTNFIRDSRPCRNPWAIRA
jgi:hypothetical protein